MVDNNTKKQISGIVGGIVLILVLVIVGLFTWRVLYFYQKISQGTLSPSDFSFADKVTTSSLVSDVKPPDDIDFSKLISTDDPSSGSENAKLTIIEFADFGCPFSREVSSTIRRLASEHSDDIRYIYRDFPLSDIHPEAQKAAEAGQCAWEQDPDKFWAFHDKIFQNQFDITIPKLKQHAVAVGLNSNLFNQCLDSGKYEQEVLNDFADGQALGVYGTPTFFFNGQRVEGAIPEDVFEQILGIYGL